MGALVAAAAFLPGKCAAADPAAHSDHAVYATDGERNPNDELSPQPDGTYRSGGPTFDARVDRDGTAHLRDTPDIGIGPGCLFWGCRMGLDDWLMRRAGQDPYRSEKLQWLDRTRDERAAIGRENRSADLAVSSQLMRQNLEVMWFRTRDPGERKRALFEMWDEVAESGDDELVAGGNAARACLVEFVRLHLPPGSAGAFRSTELAQLNAHRQSRARFAPYD